MGADSLPNSVPKIAWTAEGAWPGWHWPEQDEQLLVAAAAASSAWREGREILPTLLEKRSQHARGEESCGAVGDNSRALKNKNSLWFVP